MVNLKEMFILVIEPYTMSLTEFLAGCHITKIKVHSYKNVDEYLTEIVKSVIQRIVTAVCNLHKLKRSHNIYYIRII